MKRNLYDKTYKESMSELRFSQDAKERIKNALEEKTRGRRPFPLRALLTAAAMLTIVAVSVSVAYTALGGSELFPIAQTKIFISSDAPRTRVFRNYGENVAYSDGYTEYPKLKPAPDGAELAYYQSESYKNEKQFGYSRLDYYRDANNNTYVYDQDGHLLRFTAYEEFTDTIIQGSFSVEKISQDEAVDTSNAFLRHLFGSITDEFSVDTVIVRDKESDCAEYVLFYSKKLGIFKTSLINVVVLENGVIQQASLNLYYNVYDKLDFEALNSISEKELMDYAENYIVSITNGELVSCSDKPQDGYYITTSNGHCYIKYQVEYTVSQESGDPFSTIGDVTYKAY